MRIDLPKPIMAGMLCVILWISFAISPSRFKVVPGLLFWFFCSLNKEMFKATKKMMRAVVFAMILLSLVSFARIFGGVDNILAIEQSLRAFGVLSTLTITIVILSSSIRPLDWLSFFEIIHLPRELIYVLLATGTSLSIVSEHGKKAVLLLKLKGYKMDNIFSRFGAYTRIVMPTFSVLFQDMTVNAQSLEYRGFFEKQRYKMNIQPLSRRNQWIWTMAAVLAFMVGLSLKLWT